MKIAIGDDLEATLSNLKTSIKALKILAQISKKKIDQEMDDGNQARTLIEIWKRIVAKQFDCIERAKYDGGNPELEKKLYADYSEELGNLYIDFENNLNAAKE